MEFVNRALDAGSERLCVMIGRDVSVLEQGRGDVAMSDGTPTKARLTSSEATSRLGSLAANMAEELSNPLTTTAANLELAVEQVNALARKFGSTEHAQLRELLDDARHGADELRSLVSGLKTRSQLAAEEPALVDVALVFESSLRLAASQIPHPAVVVREYGHIPRVRVSASHLGQALLHLILNAARALPDTPAKGQQIRVRTRLDASGRVVAEVEVEGTGSGFAEQMPRHALTPSARTLDADLGLSTSRQLVTGLGGEVSVHQRARQGTLFRVALPMVDPSPASALGAQVTAGAARRGRVLVVDDDAMAARAVRRVLCAQHDVSICDGAVAALRRIMRGDRFDVIICDLMMPEKTGAVFFDELCECAPECARRIIFLTGGAFTTEGRKFLDRVPNPRLDKPFEVRALRTLVNEHLR